METAAADVQRSKYSIDNVCPLFLTLDYSDDTREPLSYKFSRYLKSPLHPEPPPVLEPHQTYHLVNQLMRKSEDLYPCSEVKKSR